MITKRCTTCGRFRAYEEDDAHCLLCGNKSLETHCACGRAFEYALAEIEAPELHCPRCGSPLRGRAPDFDG
jgi:rRNA maturation endonuclease Nob1